MPKSDAWSNQILGLFEGTVASIAEFSALFVELYSVAPTDAGGGTISGEGRQGQASGDWSTIGDASSGSGREISNGAAITWSSWAAGAQTLVAFSLFSASTAGTFMYWNTLTTSRAIADGETAQFAIGALLVIED